VRKRSSEPVLLQSPQVRCDLPMKFGVVAAFFLPRQEQEESQRNGQTQARGQPRTVQRLVFSGIRLRFRTDNIQAVRHERV